jgi:hypothetical protein
MNVILFLIAKLYDSSKGDFIMNYEFLNLYEELLALNEAKADTQRLIDFAGQELADRFLAIRNKLKSPENDLYYWIKNKTPGELDAYIRDRESTKSVTQIKKEISENGAELVDETDLWKVYHITTYEAAQKYGRDTKWCITGIDNWGDKYWKEYKEKGVEFYFLITKGEYNPRAQDCKFALAIYNDGKHYEAFDQQDDQVLLDWIGGIEDVKIPGINLPSLESYVEFCVGCGEPIFDGEGCYWGDIAYCDTCYEDAFGHSYMDADDYEYRYMDR